MPSSDTITAYHEFTPGTRARSAHVNTNFGNHRGHNIPIDTDTAAAQSNTWDLGSTTYQWRRAYLSEVPYVNGAQMANIAATTVVLEESATAGDVVAIFDDNGVLNAVRNRFVTKDTEAIFSSTSVTGIHICPVNDKKFAIFYRDGATTTAMTKVVAGTIQGKTVSVTVDSGTNVTTGAFNYNAARVDDDRVVLFYFDADTTAMAMAISFSGVTPTLGTPIPVGAVTATSATLDQVGIGKASTNRFVALWPGAANTISCAAFTVSAANVISTVTSTRQIVSGQNGICRVIECDTDRVILMVSLSTGAAQPNVTVADVTTTGMTIASFYGLGDFTVGATQLDVFSLGKNMFGVVYNEFNQASTHLAVYDVQGTTVISTPYLHQLIATGSIGSSDITEIRCDSRGDGRVIVAGVGADTAQSLTAMEIAIRGAGNVSVRSAHFDDGAVTSSASFTRSEQFDVAALMSGFVIGYVDATDSFKGKVTAGIGLPAFGILNATGSPGSTVTVSRIAMVASTGLSSLIPGATYYSQYDGTVGISPTIDRIGVALSSTELLVMPS